MSDDDEDDAAPAKRGPPRVEVLAICCPECRSLEVTRGSSKGPIAYWACNPCGHTWKESATVGLIKGRIA